MLKKRKDFIKALMKSHKEYYDELPSIFSLQQKMLELGICPRCGKKSKRWSIKGGYFPCGNCRFNITEIEIVKLLNEHPQKFILIKRLKEKKNG